MRLRKNPRLNKISMNINPKLKLSRKVIMGSKRKVNTYIDEEPEKWMPYIKPLIQKEKIENFEDFLNIIQSYIAGSNYEDASEKHSATNPHALMPLWNSLKKDIIPRLMKSRNIDIREAEEIHSFYSKPPRRVTKYQEALIENKLTTVISKRWKDN